jgi:HSP20 family protein
MTLNRWDPFRDLLSLQEKMNRLIDSTVNEGLYHRKACWCPAIDILETPDSYIFRADLPGVGKENINIEVKGNWLTISGERPLDPEPQIFAYHSIERIQGFFERSLKIPGYVDVESSEAKYENGILEIRLPKSSERHDRPIEVVGLG